jgi:hypothetical protein
VLAELERGEDDLYEWAKKQADFFMDPTEEEQQRARAILAAYPGLIHEGEDRVNADPFVIALAETQGLTVVAEEVWSGNPNKPKIPNVCTARGIQCVKLLGLMTDFVWTF